MSLSTTCRKVLPWCMPKATTATNLAVVANSCESFSAAGDDNFLNTPASKIIGVPFFTSFQVKTQYSSIAASKEQELSAHITPALLFERRHLLPTLKNALLFACAQMGGFGLGEQVVRVKVILFIGLSPPGNTNEFNPELLVISCRGGMSA